MERVYNLMLIGYVGAMIYVLTEPWHDEIGAFIVQTVANSRHTYDRGKFIIEAKIDTLILVEGM
jgi:hypothetical protein